MVFNLNRKVIVINVNATVPPLKFKPEKKEEARNKNSKWISYLVNHTHESLKSMYLFALTTMQLII